MLVEYDPMCIFARMKRLLVSITASVSPGIAANAGLGLRVTVFFADPKVNSVISLPSHDDQHFGVDTRRVTKMGFSTAAVPNGSRLRG